MWPEIYLMAGLFTHLFCNVKMPASTAVVCRFWVDQVRVHRWSASSLKTNQQNHLNCFKQRNKHSWPPGLASVDTGVITSERWPDQSGTADWKPPVSVWQSERAVKSTQKSDEPLPKETLFLTVYGICLSIFSVKVINLFLVPNGCWRSVCLAH